MKNLILLSTLGFLFFITILIACNKDSAKKSTERNRIQNTETQSLQSGSIDIVGFLNNGEPEFSISKAELISNFLCNLSTYSQIEADFTEVNIVNDGEGYLLHFFGESYSSFIRLNIIDDIKLAASKTACTTSDCSSELFGCSVDVYGACRPCSNEKSKCTKTVTNFSLVGLCEL